jgi:hypothetical protein
MQWFLMTINPGMHAGTLRFYNNFAVKRAQNHEMLPLD